MRSVTLLALGLLLIGVWSQDNASGQTSVTPPVSLVPPTATPPRANTRNSRIPPPASGREASPSVVGGPAPNSAADYDGFSAADDTDAPSQVTPPVRSRATRGPSSDPDASSIDGEDEALKRKLTICKNCK
nr:hypothetical protein [Bradyrhizobium sp. 199]